MRGVKRYLILWVWYFLIHRDYDYNYDLIYNIYIYILYINMLKYEMYS